MFCPRTVWLHPLSHTRAAFFSPRFDVCARGTVCVCMCVFSGPGQTKAGVLFTNQLKSRKNGGGHGGPAGFARHPNYRRQVESKTLDVPVLTIKKCSIPTKTSPVMKALDHVHLHLCVLGNLQRGREASENTTHL